MGPVCQGKAPSSPVNNNDLALLAQESLTSYESA